MRYMYTTQPDEGCHEFEGGIFGRPVRTDQQAAMRKRGWTFNTQSLKGGDDVRQEKEGRQEEGEVVEKIDYDEVLRRKYREVAGKKPHHKMKRETLEKKIAEAEANDNDPV